MSETIWRATDIDGACFQFLRHKPEWNGKEFGLGYGDGASAYTGNDKPPPGECWEMTVTRNGEQPRGEAWERLVEACKAYCLEITPDHIHGKELQEAFSAYEADQSAETGAQQATIERLTKERDEARAEADNLRHFEKLYNLAIECVDRAFQVDSTKPPPILPNFVQLGGCKFQAVIRLAEKFAALRNELANERASGGQVLSEHKATIAELQAKLERPEMPEAVRSLIGDLLREVPGRFNQAIAAVEAHYAPPFRIEGPGVYASNSGYEYAVVHIFTGGECLCIDQKSKTPLYFCTLKDGSFHNGGKLTKYVRPLEG